MLLALSLTLWRLPSMLDGLLGARDGGGGDPLAAALDSAMHHVAAPAETASGVRVFGAGGKELTDAERQAMLRRARASAPAPLEQRRSASDSGGPSETGEDAAARLQREIDRIVSKNKPPS